jgi:hypothetical protein
MLVACYCMLNACRMHACFIYGACWCMLGACACILLDACLVHACTWLLHAGCMRNACLVHAGGSMFLLKAPSVWGPFSFASKWRVSALRIPTMPRSTCPEPPFAGLCVLRLGVVDALPGAVKRCQALLSAIERCCVLLCAAVRCCSLAGTAVRCPE